MDITIYQINMGRDHNRIAFEGLDLLKMYQGSDNVDDAIINRVFRFGTADINEKYLKTITDTATEYVEGIFQRLREHG